MAFTNIIDIIYPVGAIYQSNSPTSPATLFGGTWSQISDKFLRCGTSAGTGGSDTHYHGSHMDSPYDGDMEVPVGVVDNNIGRLGVDSDSVSYGPTTCRSYTGVWSNPSSDQTTFNHHVWVYGYTSANSNIPAYKNAYTWYRIA